MEAGALLGVKSVEGHVITLPGNTTWQNDNYFIIDRNYDYQDTDLTDAFTQYTLRVTAYPGGRIIVGPNLDLASALKRLYIKSITLILHSLSDIASDSDLTLSKVSWTEGTVGWTSVSGHIYELFLDGVSQGTVTATSTASTKRLGGLHNATTYQIVVKDTSNGNARVGAVYMTTASLWKNTNSTGQRFLSIGWDELSRTEFHGYTQAYELEVRTAANENAASLVYDIIPQSGYNSDMEHLFGNAGVMGLGIDKDEQYVPQGTITCDNYLIPMAVAVGGLHPATTYYVRIRTKKENAYTQYWYDAKNEVWNSRSVTDSHAFGDSAWSDFVPMTTDAAHIAPAGELLYCAFEDACVSQDFSNGAPGSLPYTYRASGGDLMSAPLAYDATGRTSSWTDLCFYPQNCTGHQFNTWNVGMIYNSGGIDGSKVVKGFKTTDPGNNRGGVRINNAEVGDLADWTCATECKAYMGQMALQSNVENPFLCTPALTDDYLGAKKLSPDGTSCTLSFHAVHIVYRAATASTTVKVFIWRASTSSWEASPVLTVPYSDIRPWGDADANDLWYYKNDYSKRTSKSFSTQLTLYPGDVIKIEADYRSTYYGVLIDDVRLVKN